MATQHPPGSSTGDGTMPAASDRVRSVSLTRRLLGRPAAGAAIITVFVFFVFLALSLARDPNVTFLQAPGIFNYLDVAAQVGIIGTAVTLLMIGGEFDLSVGSLIGFAGIVIGIGVTTFGLPPWFAIVLSIVLTTGLGAINGFIVVRSGLPSFIVTLATQYLLKGVTIVMTATITNITFIPIQKSVIAADPIAGFFNWSGHIAGGALKVSILWWLLLAAIGGYVLARTRFGNWIAGVGGNPVAARNLGVPVARVKITLFAATAFSAAILASVQSMTFFSADVLRGQNYELQAITIAVIGGTLLTGGYGSVLGTTIGALALGMAQIGIVFASINADFYSATLGTLLLVSVLLNNWIRRRFAGIR